MSKYEVYLSENKTIEIEADNFTLYRDSAILRFEKDERNIAYFSLNKIKGFKQCYETDK